uniref:Transmembrane BAX inhibitor motif containing 1 n=1 Tax=Prolemur simus TaxID=1328070 RepID=A0A8C9AQB0_PROSS
MSNPSAPPPYEDRNPLYPGSPPPGGYGQPSVLPGGYPAYPGYPQPGYGHPAGYPQPMPPVHPMPMHYGPGQGYDGEERAVSDNFGPGEWDDRKVRHTFIRKVYSIISVQLLLTVAIIAIFTFVRSGRDKPLHSWEGVLWGSGVFLGWQEPSGSGDFEVICTWLMPLASLNSFFPPSMYQTKAVIIAMIITAVVAISVTIFCFQTKVDFTSCTGLFCVLGIVLMVTGIVTGIVLYFKYVYWLHMVYAALGAICFTLFLAYDTQLVLGNRKHTISPEDYITGALQIYTDIVYIFTFVLQLVGDRN